MGAVLRYDLIGHDPRFICLPHLLANFPEGIVEVYGDAKLMNQSIESLEARRGPIITTEFRLSSKAQKQ